MAIRQLRYKGDEILTKTSREVNDINDRIKQLLDDMAQTMYEKNGVGLAGVQVGVLRRLVVIDIGEEDIENKDCQKETCEGCVDKETCEEFKQAQREEELEKMTSEERLKASKTLIKLINPEIISSQGEETDVEGCLSVPGKKGDVVRPVKVTVKALDENSQEVIYEATGMLKKAFCHEIDHLNGIVFTDIAKNVTDVNEVSTSKSSEE